MTYFDFQQNWIGKRTDVDGAFEYQCVDLIKQYLIDCFGIPNGAYGDAIEYWTKTSPAILAAFDRVEGSDPQTGDIVIVKATPTLKTGHIGIATGGLMPSEVQILEQNGGTGSGNGTGTNAIRTRFIKRTTIAGLLRPKGTDMPDQLKAMSTFMRRTWFWLNGQQEPDMASIDAERDRIVAGTLDPYDLIKNWLDHGTLVPKNQLDAANTTVSGLQEQMAVQAKELDNTKTALQASLADDRVAKLQQTIDNLEHEHESDEAAIALLKAQVDEAKNGSVDSLSASDLIVRGLRKWLGIASK